jgi:catechol-2,3-dioxygenase
VKPENKAAGYERPGLQAFYGLGVTVKGGGVVIQTGLKVTGIDHVVLYVRDLACSKQFYMGLLGMEWEHGDDGAAFLRCGSQQVALFEAKPGAEIHAGSEVNHMAMRLGTGTREEVKAILEAAGCQVHGRPGDPDCLYFQDPDGHRLQVLTPAERS